MQIVNYKRHQDVRVSLKVFSRDSCQFAVSTQKVKLIRCHSFCVFFGVFFSFSRKCILESFSFSSTVTLWLWKIYPNRKKMTSSRRHHLKVSNTHTHARAHTPSHKPAATEVGKSTSCRQLINKDKIIIHTTLVFCIPWQIQFTDLDKLGWQKK